MDRYSSLSNLIFFPFFNACVLTVPIVANKGKLFPLTHPLPSLGAESNPSPPTGLLCWQGKGCCFQGWGGKVGLSPSGARSWGGKYT